ncbi:hypothetical protein HU200_024496 [Digitaria exilis]|uniref:Beta-hexosaminidase n=1 Tax=Digitaria exilis TaxID=1010633 RepID=A0A835C2Q2_9POAL|nr:hypothetical protein HU200_024496 [Digitaria exilis]
MASAAARLLLVLLAAAALAGPCAGDLWPMPASVTRGTQTLVVSKDLKLSTTAGSSYSDGKGILKEAFQRMVAVVELDHVINGSYYGGSPVLAGVHVVVRSPSDELNFGVDESYKLSVPATGNPLYAQIEAQTVYGALHALETFSQLCNFDFNARMIQLHSAPWTILDKPRFPYRGLLIDTSRHYLPVPVIKSVIDSMTFSKLNVLHWHIVDEQSFPIQIPSYPKLWNGAYSYSERYTFDDAIDIVQYAEKRGVNVLAEIDVPGHALSWGVGYPSLWPSATCKEPLDVSSDFTFQVINGILSGYALSKEIIQIYTPQSTIERSNKFIFMDLPQKRMKCHFILRFGNKQQKRYLNGQNNKSNVGGNNIMASYNTESMALSLVVFSDFSKIFKFKFAHLGGDEVNTSKLSEISTLCWKKRLITLVTSWIVELWCITGISSQPIGSILRNDLHYCWKITSSIKPCTLCQFCFFSLTGRLGSGVAQKVVAAGLRCIVSNQDKWYLDHLDATWEGFYMNEPLTNIYNPEQQKLVLGGEVCMWGEHIDASDIQQTIWPRAAAAAERLWTPFEKLAKDTGSVTARLSRFRCLLNQRGVAAAPLAGYGRSAPSEPGSCVTQ